MKGVDQKKTDRKAKDFLSAKRKELPKVVHAFMSKNPSEEEIEGFYTSYVMRYTKDSIEEILRDYNTFLMMTKRQIIKYSIWLYEECDSPISEIEWLSEMILSDRSKEDIQEEFKNSIDELLTQIN